MIRTRLTTPVILLLPVAAVLLTACSSNKNLCTYTFQKIEATPKHTETTSIGVIVNLKVKGYAGRNSEEISLGLQQTSYVSDHPEVVIVNSDGMCSIIGPGVATVTVKNGCAQSDRVLDKATFRVTLKTAGPPMIKRFSPESGGPGTPITIDGRNFLEVGPSANPEQISKVFNVTINGVPAHIQSSDTTSMTVTVPEKTTTGGLQIEVLGKKSKPFPFTVIPHQAPRKPSQEELRTQQQIGILLVVYKGGKLSNDKLHAISNQYRLKSHQFFKSGWYHVYFNSPSAEHTRQVADRLQRDRRVGSVMVLPAETAASE